MIDAFTMNRAFGSPREMGESDPGGGALPAGFECDSVAVSWSIVPARAHCQRCAARLAGRLAALLAAGFPGQFS